MGSYGLAVLAMLQDSVSVSCKGTEQCVGIRTCPSIVEQLTRAKNTEDADRKEVCGEKRERNVCGESDGAPVTALAQDDTMKKIGTFVNIFHDIAGTAYALDDKTILIKDFTYDGQGPDAFLLAGTSGRPSKSGDVVLPYPYTGETFNYTDKGIPILGRFTGSKDITLTLPPGKTVDQLKWLSVWCRDFTVNFGHVNFPANFSL